MIRPSATYQLLIFVDKLEGNWQLYCCLRIKRGKDTTKTRKSIYKLFKYCVSVIGILKVVAG